MRRFTSKFSNRIDRKGRVSVPAAFRSVLEQTGGGQIYLTRNVADGAIDAFDESQMAEIDARIGALDIGSEERAALEVRYYAETTAVQCDPEGRIILPRDLVEFAGIDEQVLFVGLGRRFQIWEPEAYARVSAERIERAKAIPLGLGRTGGPVA